MIDSKLIDFCPYLNTFINMSLLLLGMALLSGNLVPQVITGTSQFVNFRILSIRVQIGLSFSFRESSAG
jgi:hypothetical protein